MDRRSATYVNTLVYMDEPQLITLRSYRTKIVAVAIPSHKGKAEFLATSVSTKNWSDYIDGFVDLRYLFTFAERKTLYHFDLMTAKDGKVAMERLTGEPPEKLLPKAHFFSRNHTEDDIEETASAEDEQKFYVDGEWDLPDFGSFYNRYSDVYYFLSSANDISDELLADDYRSDIADAFRDKAFRGGFSYVHFYNALAGNRPRAQRLNVQAISYASPGHVSISGEEAIFNEVKDSILNFLAKKDDLKKRYDFLYDFMSRSGLLATNGRDFDNSTTDAKTILKHANALAEQLEMPNLQTIYVLVDKNALIYGKIILSFQRRLEEAAKFFAQGRMAFDKA